MAKTADFAPQIGSYALERVCIDEKTVSTEQHWISEWRKKQYVIEIIHILSLHSLLFSLPFLWPLFAALFLASVFLVISLITDTKWFIKISLCTRYACLRSDSWDTCAKPMHPKGLKDCICCGFQYMPNGRRKECIRLLMVCGLLFGAVAAANSGDELIGQYNR